MWKLTQLPTVNKEEYVPPIKLSHLHKARHTMRRSQTMRQGTFMRQDSEDTLSWQDGNMTFNMNIHQTQTNSPLFHYPKEQTFCTRITVVKPGSAQHSLVWSAEGCARHFKGAEVQGTAENLTTSSLLPRQKSLVARANGIFYSVIHQIPSCC